MPESFNPYYTWLGIPPEELPANHYRLLGLKDFESNIDAISNASDQRLAHLRTLQIGKHREFSQTLLNEVSAAAGCLLNARQKQQYDQTLRQELDVITAKDVSQPALVVPAKPIPMAIPVAIPARPKEPTPPPVAPPRESAPLPVIETNSGLAPQSIGRSMILSIVLLASLVLSAGVFYAALNRGDGKPLVENNPGHAPRSEPVPPLQPGAAQLTPVEQNPLVVLAPMMDVDQPQLPDVSPLTVPVRPAPKLTLPTDAELAAARDRFAARFADEMERATLPEQKHELGKKLVALAAEGQDEPSLTYVLLDNACGLCAEAGSVSDAIGTAEQMGHWFQLEEAAKQNLRFATLVALSDGPLSNAEREALASQLTREVKSAIQGRRFTVADECSLLGLKVAKGLKEPEQKRLAAQQRTAVIQLKSELVKYEQAQAILAVDSADLAANLGAARFLCGALGDWEQGRSHLIASGDSALSHVAKNDRAADAAPADKAPQLQVAAADAWFDWAASSSSTDRELRSLAQRRAHHWYRAALPYLTGLPKTKAEKRLQQLAGEALPNSQANPP